MLRSVWDELIESGSDQDVLELQWDLPDDDIITLTLYANNEICNGGFFQYYSNAIFDAKLHIQHLHELGLHEIAALVQASLDCFPQSEQPIRSDSDMNPIEARVLELIGSKNRFDALETEYFRLCERHEAAFVQYIRDNSESYWNSVGEIS
jgi:hypothetical protein